MRFACRIPKSTDKHSELVIVTAFPLQQWLQECVSVLRHTYIVRLVLLYERLGNVGSRKNVINRSHLPGGTDAIQNNVSKQLRHLPVPEQRNTINKLYCFAYHLGSSSQQLTIYRLSSKENIVQAKAIKRVGHVDDFMSPPPSPWLDSHLVG